MWTELYNSSGLFVMISATEGKRRGWGLIASDSCLFLVTPKRNPGPFIVLDYEGRRSWPFSPISCVGLFIQ